MQDLGILLEGRNLERLLYGLWVTLRISFASIAASIICGIIFGVIMTLRNRVLQAVCRIYLELVRVLPQLVLLFLAYFGLTRAFNINLSGETSAVLVFVVWGTAEMGDLVRSALISIPRHQYDSGYALGLSKADVYMSIILPQTVRRLIPLAINLATRMIKTTSLVVLIGVVEMLKVGQQIIEANRYTAPRAALWIYGAIFALYFLACFPMSLIAGRLERRWT
ncbi:MAG: amino acid ABC transporter permease [Clostridiales bacterium]|jgi:polar amino acid transport system permease protein|nr:amino acid ABC transporter permease [Clostridiales bacterium]